MEEVLKGSIDVTQYVVLKDPTTGNALTGVTITALDLYYTRNRTAPSTKVDATALAAVDSNHGDNQAIEVSGPDGLYRVDWPDAAFASGVDKVVLSIEDPAGSIEPVHTAVKLVNIDSQDGVRAGLTALPNQVPDAAGGLLTAGGTNDTLVGDDTLTEAQDLTTNGVKLNAQGKLDVNAEADTALSDIHLDHLLAVDYDPASKPGVATALLNELVEDDAGVSRFTQNALEQAPAGGSGLSKLTSGTAQAGAAGSLTLAAGESASSQLFRWARLVLTGGTGAGQSRTITDYNGTTKVASVSPNWVVTPNGTTTYEVQAADSNVGHMEAAVITSSVFQTNAITAGVLATECIGASELAADALAEIKAEVVAALADVNLDHLVGTAAPGNPPAGTYLDILADDGTATYDRTTDSLQAIRDRGDAAWTTGSGTGLSPLTSGTAQAGASTTITLAAGESATSQLFRWARIVLTGGTGAGQSRMITDYDGGTKIATVHLSWVVTPDGTTTYEIQAADANVGHAELGTIDSTALADGAISNDKFAASALTADKIAADAIGASELAADAVAEIKAALVAALATDTYAEPGQETPASTNTLEKKISYLFKAWRNQSTQTATEYKLFADDATTVDQKATVSDDGTTATKGEVATGP